MSREKEIEEVYFKYAYENEEGDFVFSPEELKEAISSGDIVLKSDVEKAKIEAKIWMLNHILESGARTTKQGLINGIACYQKELKEIE